MLTKVLYVVDRLTDEVQGEIQFVETLQLVKVLDAFDIVHGQVQVLQALHASQIFNCLDAVVLKLKDFQLGAHSVDVFYLVQLQKGETSHFPNLFVLF